MVTTIKAEIKITVASGKRGKLRVRQLVAAACLFLIDSQDKALYCDWSVHVVRVILAIHLIGLR